MHNPPVAIDIIILSYAKNDELKALTEQTISTLLASENESEIKFNVLVIESNKALAPFQFEGSRTIYPSEAFGFNRYLNIGIRETTNEYVCFCNNDLIFHKNWASEILKVFNQNKDIKSANPYCDTFRYSFTINPTASFMHGNRSNLFKGLLTGWCIFIRRNILDMMGPFDERFKFWYADRDYGKTLLKYKIKHALVLQSVVSHLENQSHSTMTNVALNELTHQQLHVYESKWGKDKLSIKERLVQLWTRLKRKLGF